MLTNWFRLSISTVHSAVLWINVVANIYNVIIIQLIGDEIAHMVFEDNLDLQQNIIIIETVLSLCVILLSCIGSTWCYLLIAKYWIFVTTLVAIIFDLLINIPIVGGLLFSDALNDFWNHKTNQTESISPGKLYLLIAVISIIYSAFKIYVANVMYNLGRKSFNDLLGDVDTVSNPSNEDVERNTPDQNELLAPLPSYDEAVVYSISEFAPPPSYADIQK